MRSSTSVRCRTLPLVDPPVSVLVPPDTRRRLGPLVRLVPTAFEVEALEVDGLRALLDAGPQRGSGLCRRAVDAAEAGCRSAPEAEVADGQSARLHVTPRRFRRAPGAFLDTLCATARERAALASPDPAGPVVVRRAPVQLLRLRAPLITNEQGAGPTPPCSLKSRMING